jgi:hypothetical protein
MVGIVRFGSGSAEMEYVVQICSMDGILPTKFLVYWYGSEEHAGMPPTEID